MNSIIKRTILTEKMTTHGESGQFAFEVEIDANKIEIAKAVEKRFSVDVTSVRTILYKGKRKSQFTRRGRMEGKRRDWKKAIVTLKKGQRIDFIEW